MLGVQVTQIVREPHALLPSLQAPALSEVIQDRYREHGVDLRLGETEIPEAPTSRSPGSESSRTSSSPATPASRCGAASSSTSASRPRGPGVYAIGDVAEFFDPVFGRHRRIEHWSNAAYHGTTLGHILAGADERYDIVSSFFSEQFGHTLQALRRRSGHDSTPWRAISPPGRRCCAYLRAGHAVAALVTGQDEDAETR